MSVSDAAPVSAEVPEFYTNPDSDLPYTHEEFESFAALLISPAFRGDLPLRDAASDLLIGLSVIASTSDGADQKMAARWCRKARRTAQRLLRTEEPV